nr:hypothetical protein [Lachnospiraceae bacterium]
MRNVSEAAYGNSSAYAANYAHKVQGVSQEKVTETNARRNYGKTIGKPELSEQAAKLYDELKQKYSDMDFTLVSKDMIGMAKKMAPGMGNPNKMVVLIDEEKLEKMATDPKFRQEIEGKIMSARNQMPQLTQMMQKNSAISQVGMQFTKDNRVQFFAVVDKSFKDLNERIAEKRAQKKADVKAAEKKAAKTEAKEKLDEKLAEKLHGDDVHKTDERYEVIAADSIEELMQKVDDYMFLMRSDM